MKQIWNNRVKVSSWQETSQQNPSDMSYAGGQGLTYTEGKGVKAQVPASVIQKVRG